MYILELIAKLIEKERNPVVSDNSVQEEEEVCSHSFFPIDSTGETLACSKCGLVVKNEDIVAKPRNPFS